MGAPSEGYAGTHVRQLGSWHEQRSLLFRDYMAPSWRRARALRQVKRALAERFAGERAASTEG
ncbi:GrpB family protein [Rhizobium yanglingense]